MQDSDGNVHIMNGNNRTYGAREDKLDSIEVELYTPEEWKNEFDLDFNPDWGIDSPTIK